MSEPVVIIGIGEIGGVLARGILKNGHPVFPVTRNMNLYDEVKKIPNPRAVILAVSEDDIHIMLNEMPSEWKDKLVLIQNELLPADWTDENISDPTVLVVWFEKKQGQDSRVIIPSPVFGPQSELIQNALEAVNIPSKKLLSENELLYELVRKNLYILTTNIAGLITGGTVRDLLVKHHDFTLKVTEDILDIQDFLTGRKNDRDKLRRGLHEAFEADLDHKCVGRTAPKRLVRQLHHAKRASIQAPVLQKIAVEKL